MRKLLIVVGGLLVVALLGGSVAYFLVPSDDLRPIEENAAGESSEELAEPVEEDTEEEEDEADHAPTIEHEYVKLEIIDVPILQKDRLSHYLHVELSVQVVDEEAADLFREKMPYFRDALIRRLHKTPLRLRGGDRDADMGALRRAVMSSADKVVGAGRVLDVLFAKILKGTVARRR